MATTGIPSVWGQRLGPKLAARLAQGPWRSRVLLSAVMVLLLLTPLRVAVPMLSGIVAWAGLVGERKIERLLVFGSIAGLGAFWILFRFLAHRAGPGSAASLAAGVMVAGGLAALWLRPRWVTANGGRLYRELSPGRSVVMVLIALVIGVSTYAASGALLAFNEAVELHVPLVASLQRGNWPPIDLREPPYAMEYHWGQHALAAGLGMLARSDASDLVLFATNGVAAALAFCAGLLIVARHARFFGGLLGAILFFGAGTLNWTSVLDYANPDEIPQILTPFYLPFTSGNLIVGGFFWRLHSNSTSWAFCCLLLAVELVTLTWDNRSRALAIVAGVALALIAPTAETTFCGGLSAVVLVSILRTRTEGFRSSPFRLGLVIAGVSVVLVPFLGGVIQTALPAAGTENHWKLALNESHFGFVPSWNFGGLFHDGAWVPILSKRFLQDAGPLPLLALPILVLAVWRRAWSVAIIASAALALLVATTSITLTEYKADVFRMLSAAVSLGGLAFGYAAAVLVADIRVAVARYAARTFVVAMVVVLAAAWPLSWVGLRCCGRPWPWPDTNGGPMTDGGAVDWLKKNSDFRDAVLTLPPGRAEIAPSGQVNPKGNYLGARPEFSARSVAAVAEPNIDALAKLGVRYLYVLDDYFTAAQRGVMAAAVQQRRVSQVWADADRGSMLFRIESVAAH